MIDGLTAVPVTWHAEDEDAEENVKRISRITRVVERFDGEVGDVLCNLMHYCKANQIDFDFCLEQGKHHFREETAIDRSAQP